MKTKKVKRTIYDDENTVLLDKSTGEIKESECDTYRYILEEYVHDDEDDKDLFMKDITFIKSFRGNGMVLTQKLTPTEISTIVFLCDFICYEDCVLRKNGVKTGKPLNIKELSELINVKYDTFRKTMSSLKKKQVIGFHSTGSSTSNNAVKLITVNPYIFMRGTKIDKWVVDFYKYSEWANIPRQKMKDF